ncbi:hypothetical protein LCGC14_1224930 [marine sediment metagenome]|uniref:Uncharacterized protein n=1 Tax=marine sediment metagenome TaxID=412755 RepID=A0A0F9PEN8_9ZZZZ
MPPQDETNALHLISDILDKLIDSQTASTEANTGLKESIDDMNDTLKAMHSHFTNGFRAELKSHVTTELEEIKENLSINTSKTKELCNTLMKPSFWVKLVATIVGSLAILIIGGIKLIEALGG